MSLAGMIEEMAKKAKEASRQLRTVSRAQKDAALELMAAKLLERGSEIVQQNEKDLSKARVLGVPMAMIDRLTLGERT